jgi:large subunit ribosomal protein L6
MKFKNYKIEISIPEGVEASVEKNLVLVKGPKGEVQRLLESKTVKISTKDGALELLAPVATRREKRMIGTFSSHIKNMMQGVKEPFVYELKVCSGHFPMNVAIKGDEFSIKNFLGEKIPRTLKIKQGVKVNLDGTTINVESVNKEKAGQVAADIEQLTRVTNRDRRIFQDGCWIVSKAGKAIK